MALWSICRKAQHANPLRGDIRYVRVFQDQTLLGVSLGDTALGFGRVAGALVQTL
jgi:hypothetical protein